MANTLYNFSRIGPSSPNRSDAIEMAARAGYGAKGIVYALVGALAAMAGFGYASGKLTGTRGALEVLNGQSWSTFVLGLIAAGLIGFTIWRFFQAIKDTEDKGSDLTGYAQRLGLAISGGIYGWLAYYAVRLAMDAASGGSSS
ncbi:MAG: DUF1206 domain-containing protein, partial [Gammaproteobacteria bacterium]|nr:DUF1206 domain-containing protein [Gammaproteobacteria bacterium]